MMHLGPQAAAKMQQTAALRVVSCRSMDNHATRQLPLESKGLLPPAKLQADGGCPKAHAPYVGETCTGLNGFEGYLVN